jgi:hypothetical protein
MDRIEYSPNQRGIVGKEEHALQHGAGRIRFGYRVDPIHRTLREQIQGRQWRAYVVSVTFNSCAIKRRDLPALTPIATNLRRSGGEILGGAGFLSAGFNIIAVQSVRRLFR